MDAHFTNDTIDSIRDGWAVSTWSRELPPEGVPVAPRRRAELAETVAALPDDAAVTINAGELRKLLAAADRPRERGARIEGVDENAGVVYFATIEPSGPRRLRTVEVMADDPRAFRIPVRLLEDLTRYVLAMQDDVSGPDDTADTFVLTGASRDGVPTAEALHEYVKVGQLNAAAIAKLIGRTEGRVYQLLREARRSRPDLEWPEVKKGPKTTGTAPGRRKKDA